MKSCISGRQHRTRIVTGLVALMTLLATVVVASSASPAAAKGHRGAVKWPSSEVSCSYSGRTLTTLRVNPPKVSMDKHLEREGKTVQYVGIKLILQGESGRSWHKIERRPSKRDNAVIVKVHARHKKRIPHGHKKMLTFSRSDLTGYAAYRVKVKLSWYAYDGSVSGKVKRVLSPACVGVRPGPPPNVRSIDAGDGFACALMSDSSVRCWGAASNGRLGTGATTNSTRPVTPVGMSSGVRYLAVGRMTACTANTKYVAKCWGYNSSGEIGDGTKTRRLTAVPVKNLTGASRLWIDNGATCGLSGSQLKCWGVDGHGQVGNKGTSNVVTPRALSGRTGIVSVGSGTDQTCSVGGTGGVYCWGANSQMQMQVSPKNSTLYAPRAMSGVAGASAITSGSNYICAIAAGGALKCWGADYDYELGNGKTTNSATPVTPTGLGSGVTSVSAFSNSTCAVKAGSVYCWGANPYGQLGSGNTTTLKTPTRIASIAGATGVVVGSTMSYAWDAAGHVWAWGANSSGQLATGNTVAHLSPVAVSIH